MYSTFTNFPIARSVSTATPYTYLYTFTPCSKCHAPPPPQDVTIRKKQQGYYPVHERDRFQWCNIMLSVEITTEWRTYYMFRNNIMVISTFHCGRTSVIHLATVRSLNTWKVLKIVDKKSGAQNGQREMTSCCIQIGTTVRFHFLSTSPISGL